MNFYLALQKAGTAARANFFPGLLLQILMVVFLALYNWHRQTRYALEHVAYFKQHTGYAFAFVSYAIASGLLPELLRIVCFQRGQITRRNIWNFLTSTPFWGSIGVIIDLFYRLQAIWFSNSSDLITVFCKTAVDQFLFSPFINSPLIVSFLYWRDAYFHSQALHDIFCIRFLLEKVFPIIVAGWCVWIPGVSLVYFMPLPLQLPVAVLIQVFWVLILTTFLSDPDMNPAKSTFH